MATDISDWRTELLARCPGAVTTDADAAVLRVLRDFCEQTRIWKKQAVPIQILAYVSEYSLTYTDADVVNAEEVYIGKTKLKPYSEYEAHHNHHDNWRVSAYDVQTSEYFNYDRVTGKLVLIYAPNEASDAYKSCTDLTFSATGKTILSASIDFGDEGFAAGDVLVVVGSTSNDRIYTISSVSTTTNTNDTITVLEGLTDEGTADASAVLAVDGLHAWVSLAPDRAATTCEEFLWDIYKETIEDGATADLLMQPAKSWRNFELGALYADSYRRDRTKAFRKARHGFARAVGGGMRA